MFCLQVYGERGVASSVGRGLVVGVCGDARQMAWADVSINVGVSVEMNVGVLKRNMGVC